MPQALVSTPEPPGGYYVIRDHVGGIGRLATLGKHDRLLPEIVPRNTSSKPTIKNRVALKGQKRYLKVTCYCGEVKYGIECTGKDGKIS